jgi:hypothetical protein
VLLSQKAFYSGAIFVCNKSMATETNDKKFAIIMIILIVLAASLMFYSENPFVFSSSKDFQDGSGKVSLFVVKNSENNIQHPTEVTGT